jgi:Uma2 family endonuclease
MTTATAPQQSVDPLLLDVTNAKLTVTPEQFDQLCIDNPDLRLELTKDGELIVMAPAGGETSKKNSRLNLLVGIWNEQTELGEVFESSCGYDFTALGGGKPAPDVSWIEKSRLEGINIVGFITVVPDFLIELRSPLAQAELSATDNLKPLQEKMKEYQRLGVKLGLLVDPKNKQVEIYRPGQEAEVLKSPTLIDCNEVMPGFVLSMNKIW